MKRELGHASNVGAAVLTGLGWTALLLYVLACRPSWSPDGTKLLVPVFDPVSESTSVALFDTTTSSMRTLFVRPNPNTDDGMTVQWHPDGERAIIWLAQDEVIVVPTDPSAPMRSYTLPSEVEAWLLPIPQIGENLYFSGDAIVKLDLETGKTEIGSEGEGVLLHAVGERLVFVAETDDGYDVGNVDTETLALEPFLELDHTTLAAHGIDELVGAITFEPGEARFALLGIYEKGMRLLVCSESGIESVVTPSIDADVFALDTIEWSAKREILYAATFTSLPDGEAAQFSVAEIAIADGSTRLTPLGRIAKELTDSDAGAGLGQIALDPDETTVAASMFALDKNSVTDDTQTLYLVNLEESQRPVRRVPLPPPER